MSKRDRFVTEDDQETFDGFLRYNVIDPSMTSSGELQKWREELRFKLREDYKPCIGWDL